MSLSNYCPLPFYSFVISFAGGASNPVTPRLIPDPPNPSLPAPFDNTKEVIILNLSSADNLYVQMDRFSPAPVTLAHPTIIPPGYSITLAIGPVGYRQSIGDTTYANQEWDIWYWPAGGVATIGFEVNVTYVQSQGGGGMVAP